MSEDVMDDDVGFNTETARIIAKSVLLSNRALIKRSRSSPSELLGGMLSYLWEFGTNRQRFSRARLTWEQWARMSCTNWLRREARNGGRAKMSVFNGMDHVPDAVSHEFTEEPGMADLCGLLRAESVLVSSGGGYVAPADGFSESQKTAIVALCSRLDMRGDEFRAWISVRPESQEALMLGSIPEQCEVDEWLSDEARVLKAKRVFATVRANARKAA